MGMLFINSDVTTTERLPRQFWLMIVVLAVPAVAICSSSAGDNSGGTTLDFNAMLGALQNAAPILNRLVVATAYVIGFWFVISAISELKKIGQSATMQSQQGMGGPIVKLLIGVLLMYFPSTVSTGLSAVWGAGSTILTYTKNSSDPFAAAKAGAIAIVQVVGYISFVRGLVMLAHSSDQGSQQGGLSKGIMHIIGGILAINVVATIQLIQNTLGITIT